ncbi:hypothetical protein MKX01_036067 [Papaver californicum]|nr:hypothetical protein MKX01_036067 [Papaver californicum]
MASLHLQLPTNSVIFNHNKVNPTSKGFEYHNRNNSFICNNARTAKASIAAPPFRLFEPPQIEDSSSELEPADPDFYKIGYVIMEIPLELMVTLPQKLPWMFFPDIVPVGHPIFDIINSTNPEHAFFDLEGNFWQLYGDFLPRADECTSLLLATEEDLLKLQDEDLASSMRDQQERALEFWESNWHSAVPLKIKRLARDPERFMWAPSIAQSRCIKMQMRIGALIQDSDMLIPYANMLNHSFQPNCFFHWRFKDRMLEVMVNAGQKIKKGDEMTVSYMSAKKNNMFMERYGFSSPAICIFTFYFILLEQLNEFLDLYYHRLEPLRIIQFNSNARIHLDSFFSVFNISGLPEEYYHNRRLSNSGDNFVDGAVIAAARTLPTWSDGDIPSSRVQKERLQESYRKNASRCSLNSQVRLHRKLFLKKVILALEIYQDRILF